MATTLSQGNFFGQLVGRVQLADFILNETVYVPRATIPPHSHQNAYFCLVRQGKYTEAYVSKTRSCGPLTFAFHPPGELHSESFGDAEARSFNIEITENWLRRVCDRVSFDAPLAFQGGPVTGIALRLYREFQVTDAVSCIAIEGLILEIIATAFRRAQSGARPSAPAWLRTVCEILNDRFAERLGLGQIAHLVGVHPVYLATAFRRHYNCTIGEYVRRLRLEYSCRELARSNRPLAEIAVAAGYADQSHFCRTFKNSTGLSPAQYRRLHLN
jgi:AraC family transcriptional regulator